MRTVQPPGDCPSELLAALIEQHNALVRYLDVLTSQLVGGGAVRNLPPAPAAIVPQRRT